MNLIFFGEAWRLVVFVLPDTLNKLACNADIEGAVFLAGEYVNVGVFGHKRYCWGSRLRGNDILVNEPIMVLRFWLAIFQAIGPQ